MVVRLESFQSQISNTKEYKSSNNLDTCKWTTSNFMYTLLVGPIYAMWDFDFFFLNSHGPSSKSQDLV